MLASIPLSLSLLLYSSFFSFLQRTRLRISFSKPCPFPPPAPAVAAVTIKAPPVLQASVHPLRCCVNRVCADIRVYAYTGLSALRRSSNLPSAYQNRQAWIFLVVFCINFCRAGVEELRTCAEGRRGRRVLMLLLLLLLLSVCLSRPGRKSIESGSPRISPSQVLALPPSLLGQSESRGHHSRKAGWSGPGLASWRNSLCFQLVLGLARDAHHAWGRRRRGVRCQGQLRNGV